MTLSGKTAVITGSNSGIGLGVAREMAKAGANIVLNSFTDRDEDYALAAEIAANFNVDAKYVAADMSKADDCRRLVVAAGGCDILINNAGVWHKTGPLDTIDEAMLLQTVQVNLTAAMILTRNVLPTLRAQSEAAVLNVISKSGVIAQAGQSVYSASKYGMRGFTDVLKEDEAESGVRVAGLYQSGTNTGMFAKAAEDVPNHIFTEPDDLADVVVFMLSRPAKLWMHEVRVEL